jgi:copper oxidase (laccase) domain-containing protein
VWPSAYEVGPEVAAAFPAECLRHSPRTDWPHLDLAHAVTLQLAACGVTSIDRAEQCTFRDESWFYSYRRDGAATGRQMGLVACGPAAQ